MTSEALVSDWIFRRGLQGRIQEVCVGSGSLGISASDGWGIAGAACVLASHVFALWGTNPFSHSHQLCGGTQSLR